ncbi:hypothetical protein [Polaribacter sp. R77954]|uniref:hypothetical protein n=1 Tax=Polaribacter sp. R77954 TaxID=3093870 RepID=UPI0037C53228
MNLLVVNYFGVAQFTAISQLIIDFGLVVLIWMVQLIIYPSFLFYKGTNLVVWHQKYTQRITVIVVPLMLLQLAISIFNVFFRFNFATLTTLIAVVFLWGFTLLSFAPIHFKISEGKYSQELLKSLISTNWLRTFLWSALFVFNLFYNITVFLK